MASFRYTKRRRTSSTTVDPWQLLRLHSDLLIAAAHDILGRLPDAQLAGVIVAPGAEHGDALRDMLAECHGKADPDRICVGIVPREMLGRLLSDDVASRCRALQGPQQLLPILVAAPAGMRACSLPCADAGRQAQVS